MNFKGAPPRKRNDMKFKARNRGRAKLYTLCQRSPNGRRFDNGEIEPRRRATNNQDPYTNISGSSKVITITNLYCNASSRHSCKASRIQIVDVFVHTLCHGEGGGHKIGTARIETTGGRQSSNRRKKRLKGEEKIDNTR